MLVKEGRGKRETRHTNRPQTHVRDSAARQTERGALAGEGEATGKIPDLRVVSGRTFLGPPPVPPPTPSTPTAADSQGKGCCSHALLTNTVKNHAILQSR